MQGKNKVALGQFFTVDHLWLKPQIKKFILDSRKTVAYDPFAGNGDMLCAVQKNLDFKQIKALDIDASLPWEINDSLKNIPRIDDAIIVTNPPYLAKQSALRLQPAPRSEKRIYRRLQRRHRGNDLSAGRCRMRHPLSADPAGMVRILLALRLPPDV